MKAANFTTAEWSKALSTHIINSLLHVCQTYLYNLTMNEKKTNNTLYKKYYSIWCIHLHVCYYTTGDLSYSLAGQYG